MDTGPPTPQPLLTEDEGHDNPGASAINSSPSLGIRDITLLNVITIFTIPLLLPSAVCGGAAVSYNIIGALFFLLPTGACAAELAGHYPDADGLSGWIELALGQRAALAAAWFQFINGAAFFVPMQAFLAAGLLFPFSPEDSERPAFGACASFVMVWLMTLLCCRGMKEAVLFTSLGAVLGGLLPVAILMACAISRGNSHDNALEVSSAASLLPNVSDLPSTISYFTAIMYSYAGIELSASHACDMTRPSIDYPRACLAGAATIMALNLVGALSIAALVPTADIGIVDGAFKAVARATATLGHTILE